MGYNVYFASDGHNHIKIGVAKSIESRLRELQVGNANKLTLKYSISCESKQEAFAIEKRWHETLKENHIRGEWFSEKAVKEQIKKEFAKRHEHFELCYQAAIQLVGEDDFFEMDYNESFQLLQQVGYNPLKLKVYSESEHGHLCTHRY